AGLGLLGDVGHLDQVHQALAGVGQDRQVLVLLRLRPRLGPCEAEPSASRSSESVETSMVPGSCRVPDTTMYASMPGIGFTSPTFSQASRSTAREASRP